MAEQRRFTKLQVSIKKFPILESLLFVLKPWRTTAKEKERKQTC
jgi:hypothetical protein